MATSFCLYKTHPWKIAHEYAQTPVASRARMVFNNLGRTVDCQNFVGSKNECPVKWFFSVLPSLSAQIDKSNLRLNIELEPISKIHYRLYEAVTWVITAIASLAHAKTIHLAVFARPLWPKQSHISSKGPFRHLYLQPLLVLTKDISF